MTTKAQERVERLKAELKAAQEAVAMEELRALAEDGREARKAETRRKVLLGALVMAQAEQDSTTKQWVENLLAAGLTRPAERALFGLDTPAGGTA